jgi:hypothetical protein
MVVYLSGQTGRWRVDVDVPDPFNDRTFRFSVFREPAGTLVCTDDPLFFGTAACMPDNTGTPLSELYLLGLEPILWLLWPEAFEEYPVLAVSKGTTLGQDTTCYRVRISGPHALSETTASYCFSADSRMLQSHEGIHATEIAAVADADFVLPYPLLQSE